MKINSKKYEFFYTGTLIKEIELYNYCFGILFIYIVKCFEN